MIQIIGGNRFNSNEKIFLSKERLSYCLNIFPACGNPFDAEELNKYEKLW